MLILNTYMLGQLNNSQHYDKVDWDPTLDHFEQVKDWGRKQISEGQISQEIAAWVTNLEPKPEVAFGNVKTQKRQSISSHHILMWYRYWTTLCFYRILPYATFPEPSIIH